MAKKNLGKIDKKVTACRYVSDFLRPAKAFGFDDEKRLQARFSDRALRLMWNIKNKQCEIWYIKEHELPYCILAIEDRYNICWAIKELIQRERAQKDVLDAYLKAQEENDKAQARQMQAATRTYAEALWAHKVGRVSVTV